MRKYEIHSSEGFSEFVNKMNNYFVSVKAQNLPFHSVNIIVKKFRKDKTPRQHRYYFACINELKKAYLETGCRYTTEQLHCLVKTACGYDEPINVNGKIIMVPKSIADNSEDVDTKVMNMLIDFILQFCAQELGYNIQDPRGGM